MRSPCFTVIGKPHKLRELIKPTYARVSALLGEVAGPWSNDFLSLLTAGGARRLPTRVTLSSDRLESNWEGTDVSLFQQLKEAKRLTIEKIASCLFQQDMRSPC